MKLDIHVYHHLCNEGDPALPVLFAELECRLMNAIAELAARLEAATNRVEARIAELEAQAAAGGASPTDLNQFDASIARLEGLVTTPPAPGPTPEPVPNPVPEPTPMPVPDPNAPVPPTPVPPTPVPDPNAPVPSRPPT
jgi:outer membrane biosynthesis protein TonB